MSNKPKPSAATVFEWLRGNLGNRALAPLTGTDARALQAAVQIIELYSYERRPELLKAFTSVVRCMQPQCQEFAFHAIAHVMDWSDRRTIWSQAGFVEMVCQLRCEFEPRES